MVINGAFLLCKTLKYYFGEESAPPPECYQS